MPRALAHLDRRLPDGIAVRALEPADLPGLFALFGEPKVQADLLTRRAFDDVAAFGSWFAGLAPAQRFEAVAIRGAELVGFVGLYRQPDDMGHTGTLMLAVGADAEGRGVGAFLLQTAILTGVFVAGLDKISLTVFTDNAPAVRLYRAAGFEIEGRLRRFTVRDGQARDAYAMGLVLEDDDYHALTVTGDGSVRHAGPDIVS